MSMPTSMDQSTTSQNSSRRQAQNRDAQRRFRRRRESRNQHTNVVSFTFPVPLPNAPAFEDSQELRATGTSLANFVSKPMDLGQLYHGSTYINDPWVYQGEHSAIGFLDYDILLPLPQDMPQDDHMPETQMTLRSGINDNTKKRRYDQIGDDIPEAGGKDREKTSRQISRVHSDSSSVHHMFEDPSSVSFSPTPQADCVVAWGDSDVCFGAHDPFSSSQDATSSPTSQDCKPYGFPTPPLHIAAAKGHVDFVRALLENGIDVNEPDDLGSTALHTAVKYQQEAVVSLLLMCGADANAMNRRGWTPLQEAADCGFTKAIPLFLVRGIQSST